MQERIVIPEDPDFERTRAWEVFGNFIRGKKGTHPKGRDRCPRFPGGIVGESANRM